MTLSGSKMPAMRKCRGCGAEIPANAPFGHCPNCLLELGFGPSPEEQASLSPSDAGSGRTFGDYELLEEIGRGGMGVIYKARQLTLNRLVALKMVSAGLFASPTMIQRFHLEAEAAANLHHPNIVPIYEIGEQQGQHFFSMELIDGVGLDRCIARGGFGGDQKSGKEKPSPRARQEQIARITAKVARAVDYAHQHGVLHRDIKPSNVLLDSRGEPRLTDFGVAKVVGHTGSGLTASGAIMGTPSYMAPEQAAGQGKSVTIAADIYSLGAVLYAMLTGHPPFYGETPVQTLKQVVEEEPKHPTTFGEGIDRDLATICMKCLEKEPQQRYASAASLADDLERWLRHEPIEARPASASEKLVRWCQRKPAQAAVAGLLILLSIVSTITAIQFARLSEMNRLAELRSRKDATDANNAVEVLRRELYLDLDRLWTNPLVPYVIISSDKMAALRREQVISPGLTNLDLALAVYTHQQPTNMLEMMSPILGKLEKSLARSLLWPARIDLRIYRKYDEAQDALVRGEVEFARIGPVTYVEARSRTNVSLLLAQNGRVQGCIIVNTRANIHSLADLKGKRFALVDPSSTTGNVVPKAALFEAGLTARDLPGMATNFLGSHDSVVAAVATGQFDAGACNASVAEKLLSQPNSSLRKLKDLPEEFAGLPWVASPELSTNVSAAIRTGLDLIRDKAALKALGNGTTGFVPVHDEHYNSLRATMKEAEKFDAPQPTQPTLPLNEPKP